MALEYLREDHELTEEDVIGILKTGENYRDYLINRWNYVRRPMSTMSELIEGEILKKSGFDEAKPMNKTIRNEYVYGSMIEAHRLLEEEAAYRKGEVQQLRYAESMIEEVWNCFYKLEPALQEVLRLFYIEGLCPAEIALIKGVSESTFWRKRRKAVRMIVDDLRGLTF